MHIPAWEGVTISYSQKNFKSLNMLSLGRCTTTKALLNDRAKEVQLGDPTSVSLVPKPVPFSVASDESWLGRLGTRLHFSYINAFL